MSTRLHALGFAPEWTADMLSQIDQLATVKSKLIGSAKGNYRVWRSQQGAELWFHYPPQRAPNRWPPEQQSRQQNERPVAVTPFHRGLSCCKVRIGRYLTLDRINPLEGSCMAWLPAPAEGGREQVVVMELAPFALQPRRSTPHVTEAQIVCFAHDVWAYPNAAHYSKETPVNRRIAVGSLIPIGENDVPEVKLSYRMSPITLSLVTGVVKRAIRHVNPETREPYYWLLLETKRGDIDVVANPLTVKGDISEGNIVQVCGSLLGRLAGAAV